MGRRHHVTHDAKLLRDEPIPARGGKPRTWRSGDCTVSVMTREDAGVDADEPWIASCDTHGEMIACSTRANAERAARRRDWCSGCSAGRAN